MYVLGILLGLVCAAGSSSAYLCSRLYALRHAREGNGEASWRGPLRLLVCAHVYMGVASVVIAAVLLLPSDRWPGDWGLALVLCGAVGLFYLIGNVVLFLALQRIDASRVAPLLGVKVVLLALVMRLAFGEALVAQQWVAVLLASTAAIMLGATGGRVPLRTAALVLGACMGFVMSDVCISRMVPAMLPASVDPATASAAQKMSASLTGAALVYVFCGIGAVALLPIAKVRGRADWIAAIPYTLSWSTAMVGLFSCFSIVGVVLGNILQSTRGLMSIGVGVLIARMGHHELESHATPGVIIRRIIAAAIMTTAIGLYVAAEAGK